MKPTSVQIHRRLQDRLLPARQRSRDIAVENRKRLYAQRVEIPRTEAALQRLDASEYGTCNVCNDPIEDARLDMMPEVPSCKDCQKLEPKF